MKTIKKLEAAYAAALAAEHVAVNAVTDRSPHTVIAHAWDLSAKTNAALRALQAARAKAEVKAAAAQKISPRSERGAPWA